MAINQISFGGQVLPCQIERYPAIRKATRKFRQYNLPGRSGDLFFQDDVYENVIQPYEVWVGDDHYGAQAEWMDLAKYLYLDGYQILKDTYDPDHFRKAVFNGPIDVENSWNTHGRATIEFNCRPERFRMDGKTAITYNSEALGYARWNWADLSTKVKSDFSDFGVFSEYVYSITPPAGSGHTLELLNLNVSDEHYYSDRVSAGHEADGAVTSFASHRPWYTTFTVSGSYAYLFPAIYFDGLPLFKIDGNVIGGAGQLNNPYMPSHPDIVLHRTTTHSGAAIAASIGQYGIEIRYEANFPYYFIDTENWEITMSDTLTGDRVIATNVNADPGIILTRGANEIFTSAYYEMILTPNWWEL